MRPEINNIQTRTVRPSHHCATL